MSVGADAGRSELTLSVVGLSPGCRGSVGADAVSRRAVAGQSSGLSRDRRASDPLRWHQRCSSRGMTYDKIQDFEVWKKAEIFADAITAILRRPTFSRNGKLLEQIEEALESISANMSEGFEQSTDRGFAKYLYISKGSTAETCTRLAGAVRRGCLTMAECRALEKQGEEIRRMLSALIGHLMKTPDRRRGLPSPGSRPKPPIKKDPPRLAREADTNLERSES